MIRQVNTELAVSMGTVAERGDVRELSARDLVMISGGFVPGGLASKSKIQQVTGSDGNSYKD